MVYILVNLSKEENKIVSFWKINNELNTKSEAVKQIINKVISRGGV